MQSRSWRASSVLPWLLAACAAPTADPSARAPGMRAAPLVPGGAAVAQGTPAAPPDATPAPLDDAQTVARPRALGRASAGNTPLPCAVQRVLTSSCQGCHAADPGALAPMALVTYEDLIAPAVSNPSSKVYELVARRIHAATQSMPPAASRRLTDAELAVLDGFAQEGAPAGSAEDCAGDATAIDAGGTAPAASDDVGACYRLQAHDQPLADDSTPFRAPSGEYYSCFYFDVPWPAGSQAVSIRALDAPLAHHFTLYDATEPYASGQITREAADCGLQPRAVLAIYGKSQQREQHMPGGVGLQLPPPGPGHGLLLEVHYFNPGELSADTTGVELCSAKSPMPHVAGITMLGVEDFLLPPHQSLDVQGTCTPQLASDIHAFRSLPHMHARGVALDVSIERSGGSTEQMLNVPFDFNNQRMHDTTAVIHAGDRLLTTCHFVNDTDAFITSGYTSSDEMCIDFVYAWPVGALANQVDGVAESCVH